MYITALEEIRSVCSHIVLQIHGCADLLGIDSVCKGDWSLRSPITQYFCLSHLVNLTIHVSTARRKQIDDPDRNWHCEDQVKQFRDDVLFSKPSQQPRCAPSILR